MPAIWRSGKGTQHMRVSQEMSQNCETKVQRLIANASADCRVIMRHGQRLLEQLLEHVNFPWMAVRYDLGHNKGII